MSNEHRPYFGSIGLIIGAESEWEMAPAEACGYLDLVAEFELSESGASLYALPKPCGIHISGGRLFERDNDLDLLLQTATNHGFAVEVATNTAWASDGQTARKLVQRFGRSIHLLSLQIAPESDGPEWTERVKDIINACRKSGVSFKLQVGVGPNSPFPRELLSMTELNIDTAVVSILPIAALPGDGRPEPADLPFLLAQPPKHMRCADLFALVITPGGNTYPCARGLGKPELALGNVNSEGLEPVIRTALARPCLAKLHKEGPYHLYETIRASSAANRLYAGYRDACHFHCHVMSDEVLSSVAKDCNVQASSN